MALKIFKNKGETGAIPINSENLNYNFNEIINILYPIGYILIKDDSEDYSNYLGFTWQRVFTGKTLVGLDSSDTDFNTVGKTGGEKTHTLIIGEMPKHSHLMGLLGGGNQERWGLQYAKNSEWRYYDGADIIASAGESQPHNNLQPYYVIAYWKRIA